jgi:hypothetical protein
VQEDGAAEDEVHRAPDALGCELLDGALDVLDGGPERLGRQPEAAAQLEAPFARGRLEPLAVDGGPLGGLERGHIDRDHLRAAALHLEGPEAVECADVERAPAREVGREDLRGGRAEVDPPRRHHVRCELDRVVPARVGGDRFRGVQKIHLLRGRLKSRRSSSRVTKSAR